jgi:hypothetical protein
VKILLSHAYSRHNAGDAALLSVLIQDVREVYPDAELTVLMMDEVQPGETFDAVPVRPFPTHSALHRFSSRAAKLAHSLGTLATTALAVRVPALAHRRFMGRQLAEYPGCAATATSSSVSGAVICAGTLPGRAPSNWLCSCSRWCCTGGWGFRPFSMRSRSGRSPPGCSAGWPGTCCDGSTG